MTAEQFREVREFKDKLEKITGGSATVREEMQGDGFTTTVENLNTAPRDRREPAQKNGKNKVVIWRRCPLMRELCLREECAWHDEEVGQCSVIVLSFHLSCIASILEEMREAKKS